MKFDKGLIAGSSTLLVLTLLESGDMYGYQMIEELSRRSNDAFQFQEGTLYPILHGLEKGKYLSGYQQQAPSGRMRKYYRLTRKGRELLAEKKAHAVRFDFPFQLVDFCLQRKYLLRVRAGFAQERLRSQRNGLFT